MKGKIDKHGNLFRNSLLGDKLHGVECYKNREEGCSVHCAQFNNMIVPASICKGVTRINICEKMVLSFEEFTDEREQEKKVNEGLTALERMVYKAARKQYTTKDALTNNVMKKHCVDVLSVDEIREIENTDPNEVEELETNKAYQGGDDV